MRTRPSMLFALLFLVPAAALAAGTGAPAVATGSAAGVKGPSGARHAPVPPFDKADKNGDGAIEWSEAKAVGVPKKIFRAEDFHHDGKLTLTEWQMVQVAMIPTRPLPVPAAGTGPAVPAAVAKATEAPHQTSARAPAAASSGGR